MLSLQFNKLPCGSILLSEPFTVPRFQCSFACSLCYHPLKQKCLCTKLRVLKYGKQRQESNIIKYHLLKLQQQFITMSDPHTHRHTEQHLRLNHTGSQPPLSYWDNLSKIWLTKRALKELNRRNKKPNKHSPPHRQNRRPLTRSLLAKWAEGQKSASEILHSCLENDLKEVKRFARQGGPDTSDLRGVFITRYLYFTRMLIIRSSIRNLTILLNTLRCHLQTAYLP